MLAPKVSSMIIRFLALCFLLYANGLIAQCEDNFFLGADFSSLNQVEAFGGNFQQNGQTLDPITFLAEQGAEIARVRLLHSPNWNNACGYSNNYSNLQDAITTISRAKANGMKVMLNFHYSDYPTTAQQQQIPGAWSGITDIKRVQDSIYAYTFDVLSQLATLNLFPEFVQVGNAIDKGFCDDYPNTIETDWSRVAPLITQASLAVRDAGYIHNKEAKIVYHFTELDAVEAWLDQALQFNITIFDIIGLSYFPQWHQKSIDEIGALIRSLKYKFRRDVMVVETGYPWTNYWADGYDNMLGNASGQQDYLSVSPQGQRQFLLNLTQAIIVNGGNGLLYWEPAWVATNACSETAQGSPYENATLFDFFQNNAPNPAASFFNEAYEYPVEVQFEVNMEGRGIENGVFVAGDFTGNNWYHQTMQYEGNYIYSYSTCLMPGTAYEYAFYNGASWASTEKESVPNVCANASGARTFSVTNAAIQLEYNFESCEYESRQCGALPLNMEHGPVGIQGHKGNACFDETTSTFTIGGAGMRLSDHRDDFHYAWELEEGDIGITAKIENLTPTDEDAFAAVMIRSSLAWDAPYAMTYLEPSGNIGFGGRSNGQAFRRSYSMPHNTKWIHLHRYDDLFVAYYSSDGLTWVILDNKAIEMPSQTHVGMAVHSHKYGIINVAEFSGTQINNEPIVLTDQEEELILSNLATVFPNPVSETLYVKTEQQQQLSIQIFDGQGRLIKALEMANVMQEIDCHQLSAGLYFMQVTNGLEVQRFRFVKA